MSSQFKVKGQSARSNLCDSEGNQLSPVNLTVLAVFKKLEIFSRPSLINFPGGRDNKKVDCSWKYETFEF